MVRYTWRCCSHPSHISSNTAWNTFRENTPGAVKKDEREPDTGRGTICQQSISENFDTASLLYFSSILPRNFQSCYCDVIRKVPMSCLINTATREILVERLLLRATFCGRFKGLMFHTWLEAGTGMFIFSSKRVHTYGMLFPLDLYFFNQSLHLIDSKICVMPRCIPISPEGTKHILEINHLSAIEPLNICGGEQVSILWNKQS